ncbi:MAG: polyprenyl synthetase family protein, partial [Spirochaetaceae bacterium]
MIDALTVHRQPIIDALAVACDAARNRGVNAWGDDLADRLFAFASRGKLLRGSFVAAGCDAFGVPPSSAAYRVGAAMELIQSFLLVHDDIMDQDAIRRGHPAVYEQYRRIGVERGYSGPQRFAESMGICAGDVAMLLAFQTICALDVPADVRCSVADSVAREIADVGVAQMGDVAHGHATEPVSEEEILSVYRFKTGRYTFSLPLMTGGMLAGAPADSIERLGEWGELQGIVFQIRDDQLGLIGESHEIGKPAGSDIRSNKQTL